MNELANVFLIGFGLVLLWAIAYYGWRPYRIDRVRNDLFAIRDELFLYAADGNVSFDESGYRMLRGKINALIRYAHIITVSRAIIFTIAERFRPNEYAPRMQQSWHDSLSRLPEPTQARLKQLNDRVSIVLAGQVLTGSPLLLAIMVLYLPILMVRKLRMPNESTRLKVAKEMRVELIEEQAVIAACAA